MFAFYFCFGVVAILPMDWDFGGFGGQLLWSLESLGKGTVMFCDVYVLRGEFCTIGDHHDQFL